MRPDVLAEFWGFLFDRRFGALGEHLRSGEGAFKTWVHARSYRGREAGVSGRGVAAANREDPAQRAGVLIELAHGAAQPPEGRVAAFRAGRRHFGGSHVRNDPGELVLDDVPPFAQRDFRCIGEPLEGS